MTDYIVHPPVQAIISAPHGIPNQTATFSQLSINTPKGGKGNLGYLAPQTSIFVPSLQKSIGTQQALEGNDGTYPLYNPISSGISSVRADPMRYSDQIGQSARSCGNRNAARNPNLSSQVLLHPTGTRLLGMVGNDPTFVPFAV